MIPLAQKLSAPPSWVNVQHLGAPVSVQSAGCLQSRTTWVPLQLVAVFVAHCAPAVHATEIAPVVQLGMVPPVTGIVPQHTSPPEQSAGLEQTKAELPESPLDEPLLLPLDELPLLELPLLLVLFPLLLPLEVLPLLLLPLLLEPLDPVDASPLLAPGGVDDEPAQATRRHTAEAADTRRGIMTGPPSELRLGGGPRPGESQCVPSRSCRSCQKTCARMLARGSFSGMRTAHRSWQPSPV